MAFKYGVPPNEGFLFDRITMMYLFLKTAQSLQSINNINTECTYVVKPGSDHWAKFGSHGQCEKRSGRFWYLCTEKNFFPSPEPHTGTNGIIRKLNHCSDSYLFMSIVSDS